MSFWMILVSCVVAVALGVYWRARTQGASATDSGETAVSRAFHCVAVRRGPSACSAARRLSGARFLAREAPLLPLPGCDALACQCRYLHFDDRREDERRHTHALRRGLVSADDNFDRRSLVDRRRPAEFA